MLLKYRSMDKIISSIPLYSTRIFESNNLFYFENDTIVYPWHIRPCHWVVLKSAFESDPIEVVTVDSRKTLLIESVTFTAPNSFTLNGGRISNLSQMLARMGLRGTIQ